MKECSRGFAGCKKEADGHIDNKPICRNCLEYGEFETWRKYK